MCGWVVFIYLYLLYSCFLYYFISLVNKCKRHFKMHNSTIRNFTELFFHIDLSFSFCHELGHNSRGSNVLWETWKLIPFYLYIKFCNLFFACLTWMISLMCGSLLSLHQWSQCKQLLDFIVSFLTLPSYRPIIN